MYELISKSKTFLCRKEIFFGNRNYTSIFSQPIEAKFAQTKKSRDAKCCVSTHFQILSGKIG